MKSRPYHSGKLEARRWLVEAMDEVAFGIRNKLGRMHLQYSIAQCWGAYIQSNGGHFELLF